MKRTGTRLLAGVRLCGELQHREDLGEGGRRPHHGDEGGLFIELLVEADNDDVDELLASWG